MGLQSTSNCMKHSLKAVQKLFQEAIELVKIALAFLGCTLKLQTLVT